ncbi:hypothetical protein RR46_14063 [Papilio xuthus]|uniref:Uncharacterized protein n=1 Tax=Papilio xuthus TaxID=66420 RepID=A0A194PHP9_PAPXU|nr:hypothetical protein RR46_14063 [Papilio xuthus]
MNNLWTRSIPVWRAAEALRRGRGGGRRLMGETFIENEWAARVGEQLIKPSSPACAVVVSRTRPYSHTKCKMCNLLQSGWRSWVALLGYLIIQATAYPMQSWPLYPQTPREYHDDDYYYAPKEQYYYDAPAMNTPEVYGQIPYSYYYDPYDFANEAPERQDERLAALPIGQETWFESDSNSRWRSNDMDDVNAAFLDNLILTQMAQDAQRRRENARAAFSNVDYEDKDNEDEDVRELKALAGKPLYHVPKKAPKYEDEDYQADDGFINLNGNKRSATTSRPTPTEESNVGQKEVAVPRPAKTNNRVHQSLHEKRTSPYYQTITKLLENKSRKATKGRRIEKRFVAGDTDLVMELRGLKHRIAT